MKYLKTYKLFESVNKEIEIFIIDDWNKVNDDTTSIILKYSMKELPELPKNLIKLWCGDGILKKLPHLPDSLEFLYCQNNQIIELPILPNSLQELYCYNNKLTTLPELPNSLIELWFDNNPLEVLPKGITKELLITNDREWIRENALKWIINRPSDYILLKDYLFKEDEEKLEKEYPEIISQDQFGMFSLKESIDYETGIFNVNLNNNNMTFKLGIEHLEDETKVYLLLNNNIYDELSIKTPKYSKLEHDEFFLNPEININIVNELEKQGFIKKSYTTDIAGDKKVNSYSLSL